MLTGECRIDSIKRVAVEYLLAEQQLEFRQLGVKNSSCRRLFQERKWIRSKWSNRRGGKIDLWWTSKAPGPETHLGRYRIPLGPSGTFFCGIEKLFHQFSSGEIVLSETIPKLLLSLSPLSFWFGNYRRNRDSKFQSCNGEGGGNSLP